MKTLIIDCDGVIRNIMHNLGYSQSSEYNVFKITDYDRLDQNPKFHLFDTPAYDEVVNAFRSIIKYNCNIHIKFVSDQKGIQVREQYTIDFINKFFGDMGGRYDVEFVNGTENKVKKLENKDGFIFDDYPHFVNMEDFDKHVDKLVLVKRYWNRDVEHLFRYTFDPITCLVHDKTTNTIRNLLEFSCD